MIQIPTTNSGRGPFASALRNLAKQADVKDDEIIEPRASGSSTISNTNIHMPQQQQSQIVIEQHRTNNNTEYSETTPSTSEDRNRKKTNSPAPPEKVIFHLHILCIII